MDYFSLEDEVDNDSFFSEDRVSILEINFKSRKVGKQNASFIITTY